MKAKELKKSTVIIAMIIIIAIQVIVRIYIGAKKEYFHIDEAYSYSLMNYDKIQITENDDFYNNWHTKDYYTEYLSINENEKWDWTPVYKNQQNDVHPPLYYVLLRIAASFTIGTFTKWTGLAINIIIWVFSSILVYFIAKRLFQNQKMALLTCLVAGLTVGALDTTVYIRMYELANFFVLLITYLHMRIDDKKEITIKDTVIIGISILLGSLTHYYVIVYTAFLFIMFVIKYVSKKEYKNLKKYIIGFAVAAVISIAIFPSSLYHMFGGYRGKEAQGNLLKLESIFSNIAIYLYIISKNLLGNCAIIFILLYIILYIKKKKQMIEEDNRTINLLLIPTVIYFIIVAQISSYKEIRYIMPILSTATIIIIYLAYRLLNQYLDEKKTQNIMAILLICVIISPIIVGPNLEFTYTRMNHLADKMQEKSDIPAIYLFNESNIRFLDDIYIFTKLEESYIMKYNNNSIYEIQEILKDKDTSKGLIVVYDRGLDTKEILEQIKEAYHYGTEEKVQELNSGIVEYFH